MGSEGKDDVKNEFRVWGLFNWLDGSVFVLKRKYIKGIDWGGVGRIVLGG